MTIEQEKYLSRWEVFQKRDGVCGGELRFRDGTHIFFRGITISFEDQK